MFQTKYEKNEGKKTEAAELSGQQKILPLIKKKVKIPLMVPPKKRKTGKWSKYGAGKDKTKKRLDIYFFTFLFYFAMKE